MLEIKFKQFLNYDFLFSNHKLCFGCIGINFTYLASIHSVATLTSLLC